MAADLFETYAVTIVATMVLSSIFFTADTMVMMMYPLAIGATCIVTSIIGTFFVRLAAVIQSWVLCIRALSLPPYCR